MQSRNALFPCAFSKKREAQSDLDLWFSLANSTYFPVWILAALARYTANQRTVHQSFVCPTAEHCRLAFSRCWCVNSENPYLVRKIWRLTAKFVNPISRHEIFVPRMMICVFCSFAILRPWKFQCSLGKMSKQMFQVWNVFRFGEPMQGENMLEEHFDLTPERVKERLVSVHCVEMVGHEQHVSLSWATYYVLGNLQTVSVSFDMAFFFVFSFPPRIFQQVSGGQSIHTAQQLMEGLSRIGVTCTDLAPLSSAFQLVTHRPCGHTGRMAKRLCEDGWWIWSYIQSISLW